MTVHNSSHSIVVALSGGVDSSVAAWLMKQQGYDVSAIFMKNWEEDDSHDYCAAAEDLNDAERVCEHLGISLRTVNFSTEYWDNVFEDFLEKYRRGWTPNPDILCNREIKFDAFLDFAMETGAEAMATGHYAKCENEDERFRLLKSTDTNKDQTYFLYALGQRQLSKAIFPLASFSKQQVRELAEREKIPTFEKRDSTGICFIGEQPFRQFLSRFIEPNPGPIHSLEGALLGEHQGLAFYTLGQRQGLGIGGQAKGSGEPWYVLDKDQTNNALIVGQGRNQPKLYAQHIVIADCNWISGTAPNAPFEASGKIRYRQTEQLCLIEPRGPDTFLIRFATPQWAPTPGQSVVLYVGNECIGGGIIQSTVAEHP